MSSIFLVYNLVSPSGLHLIFFFFYKLIFLKFWPLLRKTCLKLQSNLYKTTTLGATQSRLAQVVVVYKLLTIFAKKVHRRCSIKFLNINLHLTFFRKTRFIETWWIFYLKKNKNWSVDVKDKYCNSLEGQQLYQKGNLQHRYFPVNIPNLLGTSFL